MPYTSPDTVVTGTTILSDWGNDVKAALDWLANPPACHVRHNATQALANGSSVVLAWNTEVYDTATMHDTATNNSRIVLPVAGIYDIKCSLSFSTDTDYTACIVILRANGSARLAASTHWISGLPFLAVSVDYKSTAGEYVEVVALQANTSAATNNVLAYDAAAAPIGFSARWTGLG